MSFRPARVLAPAAVLILATATRLTSYDIVYGGERTRLVGDSDPNYHVLRAANWLAGAPGAPWRDPGLSWPDGADIPWPPLFDALVAGAARLVHGATPALDAIAAVAAPLPVLLSLALVLLVAALGRRLGTIGWIAASLVAVLPAASEPGVLGRADQHVLEVVLFTAALLLFVAGAAPGRRARWPAAALALVLTLAFWSWMGSALHLVPLIVAAAAWHLLDDDAAGPGLATLAGGALGAAALLAASVAWLGPPGALASGATTRVGGLHVALLVAAGAGAALVLALRRARRAPASSSRRVAELAAATALPAAALLLVPSLRSGIEGGLVALLAANPWYDRINEFRPLLGSGNGLGEDLLVLLDGYGLAHVAGVAGAVFLVARVREGSAQRAPAALLLVTLALLVPASLARRRFGIYAVVPLALAAELGLARLSERLLPVVARVVPRLARPGALRLAVVLATVAPTFPHLLAPPWVLPEEEEECLLAAGAQPLTPGAEAILTPWSFGHLARYLSDRPVIASPFGTEGGAGALEDTARFWFATDQRTAEEVLARRRAGLVLLAQPVTEAVGLHPFAPAGTPAAIVRVRAGAHGGPVRDTDAFWRMVPNRLYFHDGLASSDGPALDAFRLVWETPTTSPENPALEERWMLVERVPGARVRVSGARGTVTATVRVETGAGRRFTWRTEASPDAGGVATLRLPYASGYNGSTRVSEWTLSDGSSATPLVVHDAHVREGRVLELRLGAGGAPSAAFTRRRP